MTLTIITEPTVKLLSLPMYFALPGCELPNHTNQLENIIAVAGKVCYDSYGLDGRGVAEHVQGLAKQAHGSVLEHVNVGLFIAGVSRGLSHELVRHRVGFAYSQRSTRYADEDDCAMVLAPEYASIYLAAQEDRSRVCDNNLRLLDSHISGFEHQRRLYGQHVNQLLAMADPSLTKTQARKWARGTARQNLPHALETRLVVTGNLRAWRHFMTMRTHASAEGEIRRLAVQVWFTLRDLAPNAFRDCTTELAGDFLQVTCPHI